MEQWTDLLNKYVKVIFEDGHNHFSSKKGLLVEVNVTHLILKILTYEAINISKVLRVEELEDQEKFP